MPPHNGVAGHQVVAMAGQRMHYSSCYQCRLSEQLTRPPTEGRNLALTVESGALPAFRGPLVLCEHGGGGGGVGGVQLRHLTTNRQAISETNKLCNGCKPVTALHHQDASLYNSLRRGLYSAAGPAGELTQLSAGSGEYYRT